MIPRAFAKVTPRASALSLYIITDMLSIMQTWCQNIQATKLHGIMTILTNTRSINKCLLLSHISLSLQNDILALHFKQTGGG